MKLALLLLSISIACAHFNPDKLSRYDYEGQLLTGIPGTSQEHSGLKIKCTVELQQELNLVRLKLSEVSLKHLQEEVEEPEKKQPDNRFIQISDEELQILSEQLQKPNQFQYQEGIITEIEASSDEPHWSVNLKRGILNLLQFDLEGRHRIDDGEQFNVNRARKNDELQNERIFQVIEEGISGDCESQYLIKPWKSIPEYKNGQLTDIKRGYNVTKVINYDNCIRRSVSSTTAIRGFSCTRCGEQELLKSNGIIQMNISVTEDDFVVDSVVAEGQHMFTPYITESSGIVTFIRQTLKLQSLERGNIQEDRLIPDLENKESKGGLMFVFQPPSEEVDDNVADVTTASTEVTYLLKLLFGSVLEEELTEVTPGLFLQLVQRLKKCSLAELEYVMEIFNGETLSFEEQKLITDRAVYDMEKMMKTQSRKFLRDALPLVDTTHSRLLIRTLIENKKIVGDSAIQILSSLALTPRPDQLFVNRTMDLCKSNAVTEDVQLRATCLLTLGSLVNTLCSDEVNAVKCPSWIKEYHKEFLLTGIKNSVPKHVKLMHLKAIGNAGLTETLDELKHLIESRITDVELRVTAVWALRRLTISEPTKIRSLLLPIFLDQRIAAELRIAAYYIVMETKPTLAIVQTITESLRKESSNQVGSFVFSHLSGLANSTVPCNREISAVAKQVLRYSKPFKNGLQFSKHIVISKFIDDLKLGAFLEVNHIGQQSEPFPLSMNTKLSANVLGYQTSLAEVGGRMESLRYIIQTLAGTAINKSPVKKLIDDLVHIQQREKVQDPKFLGYLKLFGSEIRYASLDKLIIDSVVKGDLTILKKLESQLKKLTEQIDLQKAFVLLDGTHQIASEIGLPLALNITSAGVMTLNYVGRIAARPALSEILRDRVHPRGLVVEGALTPRLAVKITGRMGVDAVVLKTGVALDANANINVPINGRLKIDLSEGIYDVKINTPSQDRKLVIIQTKPYTFREEGDVTLYDIKKSGKEVRKLISGDLIKRKPKVSTISVGRESVGVEMEVKSKWIPVTGVPSAPRFPLSGPIDFNITTRTGVNKPDEYLITLEVSVVNISSEFIKDSMKMNKFRQWITSNSQENEPKIVEAGWRPTSRPNSHELHWAYAPDWLENLISKTENIIGNGNGKTHSRRRSGRVEPDDVMLTSSNKEKTKTKLATRLLLTIIGNNVEGRTDLQRKTVAEILINDNEEGFKTATMELMQTAIRSGEKPFKVCVQGEVLYPVPDFVIPDELRRPQQSAFGHFGRPNRYQKEVESFSDSGIDASTSHSGQGDSESNLKSGESWSSSESGASGRYSFSDSSEELKHLSLQDRLRIMTKQIRSKLNIQWGVSCQNDKKIELKVRFEQSKKQRTELKDKQNPVVVQCNSDRVNGLQYSPACLEIIKRENELRSVHIMATYDNIPIWMKIMYSKLLQRLRKATADNMVINNIDQNNDAKTVLISGELDKTYTKLDLAIRHPHETLRWYDVLLPLQIEPFSARYSLINQYKQTIFNNKFPPTCKVVNDQIKTFDELSYKYNITTCPHILAKDCSPSGLYIVTTRQSPVYPEKKEVTILTEGNVLELKPHRNVDSKDITVSLDGDPVEITNNQQITIFSSGERQVETIFPHMDKVDDLLRHPLEVMSISVRNGERHIDDIMREELAKIPLTNPNKTTTIDAQNTSVTNITNIPAVPKLNITDKLSLEESTTVGAVTEEPKEEQENDSQEQKYWQDFKTRMETMNSVDMPYLGRVAHVIRKMNDTVEVECVSVGLKVKFNQRYIKAQVSPWYHGLQCGLCGEYDGEKVNDLVGPDELSYHDSKLFGMSYRVPDANMCSLDLEVVKCLPKMKTVVIDDVIIDNVESTCFSKLPVPMCDCTPTEYRQELVEFSCQQKDDVSRYLKEKAAEYHTITKFSKRKTDFVSLVDGHLKCRN